MGRLDEAAKKKVVELRKAGLSFRKIKAVLELENIKVSAQAIYLFLREFQGRPPGRVRPVEAGSITPPTQVQVRTGGIQESWNNIHLQNLLQEAAHHANFAAAAKQVSANSDTNVNSSSSLETCGGSRAEREKQENKEENNIRIVSVTSLAQHNQQRASQSTVTRTETSAVSSPLTASGALMRKKITPFPASSIMLAARKRLLDKALSQRLKVRTQSSLKSNNHKHAINCL